MSRRSESVKARWREARLYAERHGTKPRLDRRTVEVRLTNDEIETEVRGLFKSPKRRLAGGKRGTESRLLRPDADFRLTVVDSKGRTRAQSGTVRFQRHANRAEETRGITQTFRRANNGVFNLFTGGDSGPYRGKIKVTAKGSFVVNRRRWRILIEPDVTDEPLKPEFVREA